MQQVFNGNRIYLPEFSDDVYGVAIMAICMHGTDIYEVGSYLNRSGNWIICYWKNNVKTDLETGKSDAETIFIEGSDVYIAGWYMDNSGDMISCCWKNGVRTDLTTDETSRYTHTIVVQGKDVYVSGCYKNGDNLTACYWKNSDRIDLSTSAFSTESYAYDIVVLVE